MPVEIIMPKVDMDMASGKVVTWHVGDGGRIEKGAPLFDIETDKAAMEVEAEATGFVHHRVAEGSEIAIGKPVAWLYSEGEPVGEAPRAPAGDSCPGLEPGPPPPPGGASVATSTARPSVATPSARPFVAPSPAGAPAPAASAERPRATPSARRLARAHGLELRDIPGSGPRGRVQRSDVEALGRTARATPSVAAADVPPQAGPLAVTRRPGAGVPLVMIHGFAGDAMSWAVLDRHLAERATIRIDLPCHGKSPLRRVRSFADLAQELRAAVDALHLETFDLVGHSLGGALALSLADTRPRKLRHLTLLAPAGLGPEINGTVVSGLTQARRPESLRPWLRALVADEALITEAFARLAHAARSPEMLTAQAAMADGLFPDGVQAFDLRAALARLTVPTRLVWGMKDRILPWRQALAAPGAVALHLFDEIGHVPHLEAPNPIGEMLGTPL